MFYFAAASFSEMARRLGQGHLIRRFLAADQSEFAEGLRTCAHLLQSTTSDSTLDLETFESKVCGAVEPINIAGLCDPMKKNWYSIDLEDVVNGARKLALSELTVRNAIGTAAWAQCGEDCATAAHARSSREVDIQAP